MHRHLQTSLLPPAAAVPPKHITATPARDSNEPSPRRTRYPTRKEMCHESPYVAIFSIFANSHSLLHKGQTDRVFNQREMQSKWKTCPQQPHAILYPASSARPGFAC